MPRTYRGKPREISRPARRSVAWHRCRCSVSWKRTIPQNLLAESTLEAVLQVETRAPTQAAETSGIAREEHHLARAMGPRAEAQQVDAADDPAHGLEHVSQGHGLARAHVVDARRPW